MCVRVEEAERECRAVPEDDREAERVAVLQGLEERIDEPEGLGEVERELDCETLMVAEGLAEGVPPAPEVDEGGDDALPLRVAEEDSVHHTVA